MPAHTDNARVAWRLGNEVIRVDREAFAVDQDPSARDQPPPELSWSLALVEPIIQYRDGQNHRLSRETTHERITLLEAESARLEALLPDLEAQLTDATRVVDATVTARLETAWAAVVGLAYEAQRADAHVTDFNRPPTASPFVRSINTFPDVWLTTRGCRLGETREWLAHAELEHRTRNDPRSAEFQAIRRRSRLSDQVSAIPREAAAINSKIYELNENLRILREQDERSDPNSAWSIAHRQLVAAMDAKLRNGEIMGWAFTG